MRAAAGLFTVLAVLLAKPSGGWLVRERLSVLRRWNITRAAMVPPLVVTVVLGVVLADLPPARLIVALTAGGVGLFALRQVRGARARDRARSQRDAVAEAVGLMAAELRAGVLPQRALAGLVSDFDFLALASRAAGLGGDVSAALRGESAAAGREQLVDLSSAWFVAERSGAPLARVLDRLEVAARDDREVEREVQSGVAPARATGRLMAVLPVVGLLLGSGMGGDPVELLTSTVPGALCLAAGSVCACGGVAWINHIASAGERSP